jgi:hypothetical protein
MGTPGTEVGLNRPPARAPEDDRQSLATSTEEARRTRPLSAMTTAWFRAAILILAPAVAMAAHGSHPWLGNPGDPEFLDRLAAAVAADPTHWAISHLGVALGSGLLALAFLALRGYLRDAGEARWSALGLPFVLMGCVLYALLPAMEFAPYAAVRAGADVAAVQAALIPWFVPILLVGAVVFAVGVAGFAIGIVRSGMLSGTLTWLVVGALVVLAATRFFPVGAAQLYVGPAAALVALWPLAFVIRGERSRR